jgi:hypothetical protein
MDHHARLSILLALLTLTACGGSVVPSGNGELDGAVSGNANPDAGHCVGLNESCASSACCGSYVCSHAFGGGAVCASPERDPRADAGCPNPPTGILVSAGGTLQPRPVGSALRLQLVYQGTALGITRAAGVDFMLPPSDGPFKAGTNAGYWFELQDGSGSALYTRPLQDPTQLEGAGPDGGFVNATVPLCDAKAISVDVPNNPNGHAVVVFGSPYGTSMGAAELGRFQLP